MILVGLGANLPSSAGPPDVTIHAACNRLEAEGISIISRSRLWRSAPVPVSDQPWFVNAVIALKTDLSPSNLLLRLHDVEAAFGRTRTMRWEARTLDLDLLDYNGLHQSDIGDGLPLLPHPRLSERAFVLMPLREVVPDWRHPLDNRHIDDLIATLPPGQMTEPVGG